MPGRLQTRRRAVWLIWRTLAASSSERRQHGCSNERTGGRLVPPFEAAHSAAVVEKGGCHKEGVEFFRTPSSLERQSCGECCRRQAPLPAVRLAEKWCMSAHRIPFGWTAVPGCRPARRSANQSSDG